MRESRRAFAYGRQAEGSVTEQEPMITAYPTSRAAGGGDICNIKRSVFREVSELWIGSTHLRPPVRLRSATRTTKTPGGRHSGLGSG
jgi:hypothetical protein